MRSSTSQRKQRGAIAIMTAILLPVLILAAALAIDLGHLFYVKRHLQKVADLAAVAAAQTLGNATAGATAVAMKNGFAVGQGNNLMQVSLGGWNPNTNGATCPPWQPQCKVPSYFTTAVATPDAAEVQLTETVPYFFVFGSRQISVGAIAWNTDAAGFSLSSTLFNINTQNSPILNALLGGLLGTSLNLSAVGYQGLANATVNIGQLQEALNLGTVNDLLQAKLDLPGLYQGVLTALSKQGGVLSSQATGVLAQILGSGIQGGLNLQLGQILQLSAPSSASAAQANINLLDLITASAMVANGQHFIQIPNIGINLPGLLSISLGLNVISPPSFAYGPPGQNPDGTWKTQAHTAQVALALDIQVGQLLGGLVHIPIYVEVAPAQAHLTSLTCGVPQSGDQTTIGTNAGLVTLILGDVDQQQFLNNTTVPLASVATGATLLNVLGLVKVGLSQPLIVPITGQGGGGAGQGYAGYNEHTFAGLPKQTYSGTNVNDLGNAVQSLLQDLQTQLQPQNHELIVSVLGLNLGGLLGGVLDSVLSLVIPLLNPLLGILNTLLETLLNALGVTLGQANVTFNSVSCNNAVLVY